MNERTLTSNESLPPRPTYGYTGRYTNPPFMCPINGWLVDGKEVDRDTALKAFKRYADALEKRNSHETGEQQPVAYVPIHPRTGPLWANTIPTLESERPAHYPLMALYAEPASRDGKETVVRTNQADSDCVMTGDWPLTRERDAASHAASCVCYTCLQNRWRASQKAGEQP